MTSLMVAKVFQIFSKRVLINSIKNQCENRENNCRLVVIKQKRGGSKFVPLQDNLCDLRPTVNLPLLPQKNKMQSGKLIQIQENICFQKSIWNIFCVLPC